MGAGRRWWMIAMAVVCITGACTGTKHGAAGRLECTFGMPGDSMSADGLPNIEGAVTNRSVVDQELQQNLPAIKAEHPEAVAIDVGPGYGRAWTGTSGGPFKIVHVKDWVITVHVPTARDCPRGKQLATVPVNSVRFVFYQVGD